MNPDKIQKRYDYQEYYLSGNGYIPSYINIRKCIFFTTFEWMSIAMNHTEQTPTTGQEQLIQTRLIRSFTNSK